MAAKPLLLALAALIAVPVLPVLAPHGAGALPTPADGADATHGDRFVGGFPDVRVVLAGLAAEGAVDTAAVRWYGCADPNAWQLGRFQLVYAQPYDQLDAYLAMLQPIRDNFEAASAIFMQNGLHPDPPITIQGDSIHLDTSPALSEPMRLRAECDETNVPTVAHVWLNTPSGSTTFGSVKSDLQWQGYDLPNTKYVVFVDGGVHDEGHSGRADIANDDSTGVNNQNNNGAMYAMTYLAAVDREQMYTTVLHEIGHTMGAVQHSAPHSTSGWHCWDGLDMMCYDDDTAGSERYTTYACPERYFGPSPVVADAEAVLPRAAFSSAAGAFVMPQWYNAFDCGRDDYFSPHPHSWDYLCDHWNVASRDNLFVDFLLAPRPPLNGNYCY